MKLKVSVVIAFLLIVAIGVTITASKAKQQSADAQQIAELEEKEKKQGLPLRERVKLAKLKGQKDLFVPLSYATSDYITFSDMDTAAAIYTIVIAQPVALMTYTNEEGRIGTSYKFKTLEVLSEPKPSKFPFTFRGKLPAELQPFGDDEYLVSLLGGTLNIEGVNVTTKYDDYEQFSLSKKYLLFLEFDTSKKVGGMDMGPLSALTINDDGALETLDKKPHAIKRAVDKNFDNSVERLKNHLKARVRH